MSQSQTEEEKNRILTDRMNRTKLTAEQLALAADMAVQAGIPIASHDDDSLEKLDYVTQSLHARICEFPVELSVAKEARRRGMSVVVGATNVLMGRSHSNNLSAREAIENGCADILVSDYFPAAILHGVFKLWEDGLLSLPQAVNMATLKPRQGCTGRGTPGLHRAGQVRRPDSGEQKGRHPRSAFHLYQWGRGDPPPLPQRFRGEGRGPL